MKLFILNVFLYILSLAAWCFPVHSHNYQFKGGFSEWGQKHLNLISIFLPDNPVILQVGENNANETIRYSLFWPKSNISTFESLDAYGTLDNWCKLKEIEHIDLLYLGVQETKSILQSSLNTLNKLSCIHIHFLQHQSTQYSELKKFLEKSGFQLLAHWLQNGLERNIVFVKNDYFFNDTVCEYLKNNQVTIDKYRTYYEPFFKVYYDLDDNGDSIKNIIKQGRAYEGDIGVIIDHLVKPGSIAIDIGAHIGVHTITMSRKVGPQGAVLAFEPHKKLYMELLNNLRLNNCTNVIPIAKALSNTAKMEFLNNIHIVQDNILNKNGDWIETITLDSLKIENLSLIKMDVENYEYFVLKGARKTILKNKPVIVFECWIGADYEKSDPKIKANFDRVISLIESYGYEIYVIYCNDFIAFPVDATYELANYKNNFRRLDLNNFDLGL